MSPIRGPRGPAAGRAFAIASALGYGAALPLSRLTFDEGTNAFTVAFLRYLALSVILWGAVAWRRRPGTGLGPRLRTVALALGVCFAAISLGTLLGSTFMPVSLTVLVFYTYPSLVLITAAVLDRRVPRALEAAVLAMAFVGLALALDVDLSAVSVPGLALAALAALSAVACFVLIERALHAADTVRSTGFACVGAAVTSGLALAAAGNAALPVTATGWALLALVVALFTGAVVCMFVAIRLAGSVRASMLLFLEPVTAIVLAVALLGERLSALQWLGSALVIIAVALASVLGPATHAKEAVG